MRSRGSAAPERRCLFASHQERRNWKVLYLIRMQDGEQRRRCGILREKIEAEDEVEVINALRLRCGAGVRCLRGRAPESRALWPLAAGGWPQAAHFDGILRDVSHFLHPVCCRRSTSSSSNLCLPYPSPLDFARSLKVVPQCTIGEPSLSSTESMSPTSYLLHTVLSQSPPCPTLSFIPEPAESCKVMSPYIPPEITTAIISAVDVDLYNTGERTLTMCALVCRAWLPRSRTKLFEAIYIRNQRNYDLLVERFVRSETMSHYLTSVNSFYIQPFGVDSPSSVARLFLIEFAGKLPGLRVWDVGGIDWTHQRPSVKWPLLLSHFRTITYLRLWECRFSSFSDFRRLLTALPLLSTLNILHVTWPAVSPELHLRTTPGPMCRTYWPELRALLSMMKTGGNAQRCSLSGSRQRSVDRPSKSYSVASLACLPLGHCAKL
ncbi:hypothetical protein L226DRAFT_52127 [Lentinus tigrinus ALCF2SS1-7]|uniref:uncharacterized protein n=1 Tax=Lentinus tigrinus ALCF2SS1-7 TaxID=1328758 RepID=UPI001165F94D|nr:hypothetical protein L226DRAFT_52127 [Lentinus tigrinus ALCF2SS1-7]